MESTDRLPVFVYGTLRPGQGNYSRLLAGRIATPVRATLPGHALYGRTLPFPYVVPAPGHTVVGDLVTPLADLYDEVLDDLDWLEGYRAGPSDASHYVRTRVAVESPAGTETAWVYLAGTMAARRLRLYDLVDDGDWLGARDAA
jgi:gamma-glutamylcyclotransferase (GGCT)/AIG2-like uncharacterized protein YtfP